MYEIIKKAPTDCKVFFDKLECKRPNPPLAQETISLDESSLWSIIRGDSLPPFFGILENYYSDIAYLDKIDENVFNYLLKPSLAMWCESLHGLRAAFNATCEFHAAFSKNQTLLDTLSKANKSVFVESFLSRYLIGFIHNSTHTKDSDFNWVPYWVSLFCGFPMSGVSVIEALSTEVDLKVHYVKFLSTIVYSSHQNPFLNAGTRFDPPWKRFEYMTTGTFVKPDGINKLKKILNESNFQNTLVNNNGSGAIDGFYRMVCEDMLQQKDVFVQRTQELLANLANPSPPEYWSNEF